MQILVDGDILVYRAGFSTEYPKYLVCYGEDYAKEFQYKREALDCLIELEEEGQDAELVTETVIEPIQNAYHNLDSIVGGIAHHFGVDTSQLTLVLSCLEGNFRDEVAFTKPYKGNRSKPKPVYYHDLREWIEKKYNTVVTIGEEADDYMGYTHYNAWYYDPESSVIATIDKDLDMIPGIHYNFVKEEQYYVDEDEAQSFFLHQLITGDSSDNIPGIPGMGPKGAAKFIEGLETDDKLGSIRELYSDTFGDEAEKVFDEQATLLWIRRAPKQSWKDYWGEDIPW
jgi:hypothetical protein